MADGKDIPARDIAERLLDQTGNALIKNDFPTFAQCFALPHTVSSDKGTTIIQDEDHFRAVFETIREKYHVMGVTEQVRMIEAAEYRSNTQIASTHITHLFAGSARLSEPYPVFSLIELQENGEWRAVYSDYAVGAKSPQASALHLDPKTYKSKGQPNA